LNTSQISAELEKHYNVEDFYHILTRREIYGILSMSILTTTELRRYE